MFQNGLSHQAALWGLFGIRVLALIFLFRVDLGYSVFTVDFIHSSTAAMALIIIAAYYNFRRWKALLLILALYELLIMPLKTPLVIWGSLVPMLSEEMGALHAIKFVTSDKMMWQSYFAVLIPAVLFWSTAFFVLRRSTANTGQPPAINVDESRCCEGDSSR